MVFAGPIDLRGTTQFIANGLNAWQEIADNFSLNSGSFLLPFGGLAAGGIVDLSAAVFSHIGLHI